MPAIMERIDARGTPTPAVVMTGLGVAALALIGNVKTTWSFSAFTVLVYYAITNLAALRLPDEHRRYPRWVAAMGLGACLFLAFWVETTIWLVGLAIIGAGLLWHEVARRQRPRRCSTE
jgi:APA family basic amino acid/polyamine antiporter